MARFLYSLGVFFLIATCSTSAQSGSHSQDYYRSFWNPAYHGQRLDYCTIGERVCGLPVANRYCQLIGYETADQQVIDYTTRSTRYIDSCKRCKGWHCKGFLLVRCRGELTHKPVSAYYYREQAFVFPRFNHSRVDWCYEDGKGCGQRAAYSFCRRMGYMRAQKYKMDAHVSQTRALGNHKWCLGDACNAFSSITCYR